MLGWFEGRRKWTSSWLISGRQRAAPRAGDLRNYNAPLLSHRSIRGRPANRRVWTCHSSVAWILVVFTSSSVVFVKSAVKYWQHEFLSCALLSRATRRHYTTCEPPNFQFCSPFTSHNTISVWVYLDYFSFRGSKDSSRSLFSKLRFYADYFLPDCLLKSLRSWVGISAMNTDTTRKFQTNSEASCGFER